MKVTFVNNQAQLGGAETVVQQLWRGFPGSRLRVAAGKTYPPGVEPLYPRVLSRLSHTRLHRWVERAFPRFAWTDVAFRRLAGSDADIIHLHSFHGDYASIESLAFLAQRKPVVWTFHRFWGITGGCDHPADCEKFKAACGECPLVHEWPMNGVDDTAEALERKACVLGPTPLCIVAPSQHLAQKVRDSRVGCRWRVEHIPNGVDPARFTGARKHDLAFRREMRLEPGRTCALVVNRDFRDPLKGFATIEAALVALPAMSLQVVLAGGNAEWAASRLPARHAPMAAGYLTDRDALARWYEAADIFLYASPRENFPCVILEAMASECCVVSTPTDGVLEQVEHGYSGWLAESFAPEDLARVLLQVLDSGESCRRVGQVARERVVRNFSEAGMIEAHRRLYEELAG